MFGATDTVSTISLGAGVGGGVGSVVFLLQPVKDSNDNTIKGTKSFFIYPPFVYNSLFQVNF